LEYQEALQSCKTINDDVISAMTFSISKLEEEKKNFEKEVKLKLEEKKKKIQEEQNIWDSVFL